MTHEYSLLLGGVVRRGGGRPDATAIAFAHDTVLAVGTDDDVRAISRGDSRMVDLGGRRVEPREDTALEPGSPASFAILDASSGEVVAVVVDGHVERSALAGLD